MSITITVRDETAAGASLHELPLVFPSEQITVRELIRERVYQEVQDFHRQGKASVFRGLVQPSDTEVVLNGVRTEYRFQTAKTIDWKEQYDRAVEAFQQHGFLILVDDRQVEDLEEVVTIGAGTQVAFVKLTLLVGG